MSRAHRDVTEANIKEVLAEHQAEAGSPILPIPNPIPPFALAPNSGFYNFSPLLAAQPAAETVEEFAAAEGTDEAGAGPILPTLPLPILLVFEELRLDVDGNYPQMKASGRLSRIGVPPVHWIANVQKIATNTYSGGIFYKEGNASLMPQTTVKIVVTRALLFPTTATVTFTGGGVSRVRGFAYKSR